MSANTISNTTKLDSVYNTIVANSSKWITSTYYNDITGRISKWNSAYDTLITKNNYISWNDTITNFDTLSTSFYSTGSGLNEIDNLIDSKISIWNNKPISTILSSNSAKWNDTTKTVVTSSANWFFNDKDGYKSMYSYVAASSAGLTNVLSSINDNADNWNSMFTVITGSSSQFLSGSDTINLSTNDLYVYGETHIKGNLSALGGRFLIDTTLNTTSGFNINNIDDTDAVVVDKIGGGAIFNLNTVDSTVLYVKANPKTVGINLSAISDAYDDISNILLTVSGNISATGYVYPFPVKTTLYATKSGAYETAYTYLTANSGAIDTFILSAKPLYDGMVTYINDGNISSFSAVTIPYYDNYANQTNKWFSKNTQTNNFIALCGNVFDVDTKFADNSSKYEQTYNFTSTAILTSKGVISYFFGNSIIPSSQKINLTIQDNIKIDSWELYANESTLAYNLSVDILSSTYADFGRIGHPSSITKNNPPNLTIYNKNSASDLDLLWDGVHLPKGSILQFELINTNNSPVSGLLINLTVIKQ